MKKYLLSVAIISAAISTNVMARIPSSCPPSLPNAIYKAHEMQHGKPISYFVGSMPELINQFIQRNDFSKTRGLSSVGPFRSVSYDPKSKSNNHDQIGCQYSNVTLWLTANLAQINNQNKMWQCHSGSCQCTNAHPKNCKFTVVSR